MNFMKAISIFIARIFTSRMIHAFVLVAPLFQTIIDIVFVGVNQAARLNDFGHHRLNGDLLNIRQHPNDNFTTALDHAQNRRFFFCQSATPPFSFEFSPSALAVFARHNGWIPFMTSRNVHFVDFDLADGQTILVDTGCLVALDPSVRYEVKLQKDLKRGLFGGEGLFLVHMTGPGHVTLQTLPFSRTAERVLEAAGGGKGEKGGILGNVFGG